MKFARSVAVLFSCLVFAGSVVAHELRFVTDAFPPFTYAGSDGNKAVGPVADVIRAVCRRIGANCTIELFPWPRATSMADNGEVNGLFALPLNAENEEKFLLSETIIASAISLFAPTASSFRYHEAKDLDGYTVGVHAGSSAAAVLAEVLKASLTGRAEPDLNNVLVLKKLASGRYGEAGKGLAAINRDVALYLMQHEPISGLKEVGELSRLGYGVGFPKSAENAALFKDFNRGLKALIREGQVKRIVGKYGLRTAP